MSFVVDFCLSVSNSLGCCFFLYCVICYVCVFLTYLYLFYNCIIIFSAFYIIFTFVLVLASVFLPLLPSLPRPPYQHLVAGLDPRRIQLVPLLGINCDIVKPPMWTMLPFIQSLLDLTLIDHPDMPQDAFCARSAEQLSMQVDGLVVRLHGHFGISQSKCLSNVTRKLRTAPPPPPPPVCWTVLDNATSLALHSLHPSSPPILIHTRTQNVCY